MSDLLIAAELISLRERVDRNHEATAAELSRVKAEFTDRFGRFAADVQSAYSHLRDELLIEPRLSAALLLELIDRTLDLERLAASGIDIGVALRAAQASLGRFGVARIAPEVGEPFRSVVHERVGVRPGDHPECIAEVIEPGYTSTGEPPVIRRAKVWTTG